MRFMLLVIPGNAHGGAGARSGAEAVAAMMRFNGALRRAGVLLTLDGLHPLAMGARVTFAGGRPKVTDGPSLEAKGALGGYWMIRVRSKAEAVEWAKRVPASNGDVVEVRQVQEYEDLPADLKKAGADYKQTKKKDQQSGEQGG